MPGVVAVTELPSGVAVSAKTFDQALKAGSKVKVTWGSGSVDGVSDEDIKSRLTAAIPPMTPALPHQKLDATFSFAFVNHAPMEVGSAVANELAAQGAQVFLSGRTKARVQQLAQAISSRGETAAAAEVDALDEDAVTSYLDDVVAAAGRIFAWLIFVGYTSIPVAVLLHLVKPAQEL
jgi:protein involved in temperature-dependent protein secretion